MKKLLLLMISVNLFGFENPCFEKRNWEEVQCSFKKSNNKAYKISGEMVLSKEKSRREYDEEFNETARINGISLRKHNIGNFKSNIENHKSNLEITKSNIKVFEKRISRIEEIIKSYSVEVKEPQSEEESTYSKYKKRFMRWWNNDFKKSFKSTQQKINKYLKENDFKTFKEIDLPKYSDGIKERELKKKNAISKLNKEIASEKKNLLSAQSDIKKYNDLILHSKEMISQWEEEIVDFEKGRIEVDEIKAEYAKHDSEGEVIFNKMSGDIKNFFDENELNDCQKACVVKCTTATYLTHEFGMSDELVDLSSGTNGVNTGIQMHGSFGLMMKERVGVCFDYAVLYTRLAVKNGLRAKSLQSIRYKDKNGLDTGHAFNSVEIDGKRYISEPQQSTCNFGLIPSS